MRAEPTTNITYISAHNMRRGVWQGNGAGPRQWTSTGQMPMMLQQHSRTFCGQCRHGLGMIMWQGVRAKGYTLEERRDKRDVLRGYTVGKNDVIYKASELGKGRNLMASKIETTWMRLHNQSETRLFRPVRDNGTRLVTPVVTKPVALPDKPVIDYSTWRDVPSRYELAHDGRDYRFYTILHQASMLFDSVLTENN